MCPDEGGDTSPSAQALAPVNDILALTSQPTSNLMGSSHCNLLGDNDVTQQSILHLELSQPHIKQSNVLTEQTAILQATHVREKSKKQTQKIPKVKKQNSPKLPKVPKEKKPPREKKPPKVKKDIIGTTDNKKDFKSPREKKPPRTPKGDKAKLVDTAATIKCPTSS